ncbi:hypothetical protein SAMN04489860_0616 [Paraoerskovia marina]|uniref:Uncharacterized protein n=1 Tax=Paraoerskovia marina TaxID=545619 RepID=A0A1H1NTZ9_9CELL|nr:hypothetical protein [Paraoerskovia marina]SDS02235.1 hypothetical protein SAMN04489860_0616 [Paraoerskovia marina]
MGGAVDNFLGARASVTRVSADEGETLAEKLTVDEREIFTASAPVVRLRAALPESVTLDAGDCGCVRVRDAIDTYALWATARLSGVSSLAGALIDGAAGSVDAYAAADHELSAATS